MKRTFKLTIALLMSVLFLMQAAGCGQPSASEASSEAPAASAAAETSGTAPTEEAAAETGYDEHMTITWAVYADSQYDDINSDDFAKIWSERFNLDWEIITLPADQWNESIRIWANAQDLPDVSQWDYNHVDGSIYAEQELVRKLPDDWRDKWVNAAKAFDGTELGPKLIEEFGGTYFLPRPVFANNKPVDRLMTHQGIYLRRDWVEAAGAEAKDSYTVPELLEVARLIKEKDPAGLGDKLIPIGNGINEAPFLFVYPVSTYSQNLMEYYQDASGAYQWGPAAPETLQGLKYYQQAFDEGLLHPEFFSYNVNDHQENFYIAGTSAICQAAGMAQVALRFANNFQTNLGVAPEDWLQFSFPLGDDGKYHGPEAYNFWAALIMSPNMEEEKFERVMDVIDYSCTDQGQYEIRMGIENVDWKLDGDTLVNLMPEGETAVDKYYSIRPFYHNMYIVSDDFGLINPTYPQMFRDMAYNQYKQKEALITDESLGQINWDVYFHDSENRRRAHFNLAEEYAALVVAEGNMEDKWNAWVEEKMQLVQPVLDELNA